MQHFERLSYGRPPCPPTPPEQGQTQIGFMAAIQTLPTAQRAPSLALLMAEPLRALFDSLGTHAATAPPVTGDGHPVIVYPGLGAGSINTSQLRNFLTRSGFEASDWGGGVNIGHEGDFDEWLAVLVGNVRALQARHSGRRVSLVGWSLGGIFAREIAKRAPDAVRTVITLATPFGALDAGNHPGKLYMPFGGSASHITPQFQARLRETPPVGTTSIYSKSDGIVSWRGCIERRSDHSESVEVDASHLGMASHPAVLRIVSNRLAQPEGRWRALRRSELLGRD